MSDIRVHGECIEAFACYEDEQRIIRAPCCTHDATINRADDFGLGVQCEYFIDDSLNASLSDHWFVLI